jgi:hypothetical protein
VGAGPRAHSAPEATSGYEGQSSGALSADHALTTARRSGMDTGSAPRPPVESPGLRNGSGVVISSSGAWHRLAHVCLTGAIPDVTHTGVPVLGGVARWGRPDRGVYLAPPAAREGRRSPGGLSRRARVHSQLASKRDPRLSLGAPGTPPFRVPHLRPLHLQVSEDDPRILHCQFPRNPSWCGCVTGARHVCSFSSWDPSLSRGWSLCEITDHRPCHQRDHPGRRQSGRRPPAHPRQRRVCCH